MAWAFTYVLSWDRRASRGTGVSTCSNILFWILWKEENIKEESEDLH